ncbi:MAG: GH32 C-terminal domain-containing protein [Phycisphaerae bacterium]|nr:GH32 C-terminal domain-containing protein [Phycisphaerae bacterium]
MFNYSIRFILGVMVVAILVTDSGGAEEAKWVKKAREAVKTAIPLAEKDTSRPVYHFRPPAQWMNDICGAIFYKGYYHIFYQYNPFSGDRWGYNYSLWAHARSRDLVHWEELDWALLPMVGRSETRCNSGCVTLDGNGRPMLFYTFVYAKRYAPHRTPKREQWAAIACDEDLIKWKRIKENPILAAGMNGVPANVHGGWSDPFVFRSKGRAFVTFKSCGGLVGEAQNKELTKWKYAGKMDGVSGECPNFFPLQDRWVLIRSTHPLSYIVGDFDAKAISFKKSGVAGIVDYGFGKNPPKDRSWTRGLYGTNAFVDKDGRRILVGWICGFKPKRGWNGCMSLPRVLTLDKARRLVQTPAPELKKLRAKHREIKGLKVDSKSELLKDIKGDTLEIIAQFTNADAGAFGLKVRQSEDGNSAITIRYADGKLNVAGTELPLKLGEDKTLKLHVFIDKSVLEVFINDGATSVTRVDYPGDKDLGVSVFAENGAATLKSLDAWHMKSIW